MTKYKLIQQYPGTSLCLGDIVEWGESGNIAQYMCKIKRKGVNGVDVSKFPEFWEEVIEKDYKILSLARFCSIKPTILLVSDYGDEYIEALIKCDNARIHSIERLSDGEVFTIGDKVHLTNGNYYGFELKEFKFFHNGKNGHLEKHRNKTFLKLGIISDLHKESTFFYLEDITKIRQPLVKTEDGINIFEGDTAFALLKRNLNTLGEISVTKYQEELLYFKTREEAEEYRMLNKPCLTLKNVLEAAEFPLFDFEGKLRTIVKNTMYD